jgi:hypothetical protein
MLYLTLIYIIQSVGKETLQIKDPDKYDDKMNRIDQLQDLFSKPKESPSAEEMQKKI